MIVFSEKLILKHKGTRSTFAFSFETVFQCSHLVSFYDISENHIHKNISVVMETKAECQYTLPKVAVVVCALHWYSENASCNLVQHNSITITFFSVLLSVSAVTFFLLNTNILSYLLYHLEKCRKGPGSWFWNCHNIWRQLCSCYQKSLEWCWHSRMLWQKKRIPTDRFCQIVREIALFSPFSVSLNDIYYVIQIIIAVQIYFSFKLLNNTRNPCLTKVK